MISSFSSSRGLSKLIGQAWLCSMSASRLFFSSLQLNLCCDGCTLGVEAIHWGLTQESALQQMLMLMTSVHSLTAPSILQFRLKRLSNFQNGQVSGQMLASVL